MSESSCCLMTFWTSNVSSTVSIEVFTPVGDSEAGSGIIDVFPARWI